MKDELGSQGQEEPEHSIRVGLPKGLLFASLRHRVSIPPGQRPRQRGPFTKRQSFFPESPNGRLFLPSLTHTKVTCGCPLSIFLQAVPQRMQVLLGMFFTRWDGASQLLRERNSGEVGWVRHRSQLASLLLLGLEGGQGLSVMWHISFLCQARAGLESTKSFSRLQWRWLYEAAAGVQGRAVFSPQLLSLVSEEALPNKMSLSWDMPLSCDLVLMRYWARRISTRSCSCLSSR